MKTLFLHNQELVTNKQEFSVTSSDIRNFQTIPNARISQYFHLFQFIKNFPCTNPTNQFPESLFLAFHKDQV